MRGFLIWGLLSACCWCITCSATSFSRKIKTMAAKKIETKNYNVYNSYRLNQ
ncbi:protein of unknown function [Nitrospina watsonii]|uniref:Uncharacterized protein n=1 Tax=Nitrospina watsonii TaxID=1323948 RepID=A0ABM9HCP1_9BACT|nr:protein of unknown function [Nitrospina watsonii]